MISPPPRQADHRKVVPLENAEEIPGYRHHRRIGDRVYELRGQDFDGASHAPGEIVLLEKIEEEDERGLVDVFHRRFRAVPLAPGEWDAILAKAARKAETAAAKLRPGVLNVLDALPASRWKTARELMVAANAAGAVLRVVSVGDQRRLLVHSPGGGWRVYAEHLARVEPLVVGILDGKPVPCALEHKGKAPEAVTMATIAIPACAEHAGIQS